jgi:hypothetical protein
VLEAMVVIILVIELVFLFHERGDDEEAASMIEK